MLRNVFLKGATTSVRQRLFNPLVLVGLPSRLQCCTPVRDGANFSSESQSSTSCSLPRIIPVEGGVPLHVYTHEVSPGSLAKLEALARSPLPVGRISVMPDVHSGGGVTPVGTVFASEEYICPSAVGSSIGCGMTAVPIEGLYRHELSQDDKILIQQRIKKRIPLGRKNHVETPSDSRQEILDQITANFEPSNYVKSLLSSPKVADQLGTLGGGNSFLEVLYEQENEQVWIVLHSGPRKIGVRVSVYHYNVAEEWLWSNGVDAKVSMGLNYMPIDSEEGQDYLKDMMWCQNYAYQNRRLLKEAMLEIVHEVTGKNADISQSIDIHHNYCSYEEYGGQELLVTRRGATSAKLGEMGIVAGSMGAGSYVTRGKGNLTGWNSSSHGAGRKMSLNNANEEVEQQEFEDSMQGIVCNAFPVFRDEGPHAYKDVSEVMENQKSLTDIVYRLLPLINVKGFVPKYRERKKPKKKKKKNKKKKKEENKKKKKKKKMLQKSRAKVSSF